MANLVDSYYQYYEEFVPLNKKKQKRVEGAIERMASDVLSAPERVRKLTKKPFAKYRPGVKAQISQELKSARKKQQLVRNASDALIHTDVTNRAKAQRLRNLLGDLEGRNKIVKFNREEYELVIDYLLDEGLVDNENSAIKILEAMSDEWFDVIIEASRIDSYRERQFRQSERELPRYNATKDIARDKNQRRNYAFLDRDTHPDKEPRTSTDYRGRIQTDQLRSQRKRAHQGERNRRKKRPGTTPEERKLQKFSPNKPKNVALQDRKREGYPTDIAARKNALISKGERRRTLRQQAINAIRRSLGSGYTD